MEVRRLPLCCKIHSGDQGRLIVRRTSILVVEDDDSARETLCEILVELGYEAEAVSNGALAQTVLTRGPLPDVILSDLEMPVVSGHTLCPWICERFDVPVVLISGNRELASIATRLGAAGYVRKPATIPTISAAVLSALRVR